MVKRFILKGSIRDERDRLRTDDKNNIEVYYTLGGGEKRETEAISRNNEKLK
jgi:hypothetical protein